MKQDELQGSAGPGRRERKKRALKRHIYECALGLFMERGFEDTTIDEIAETADIGRATFFNHYPAKEDILHELAAYTVDYARGIFDREFSAEGRSAREKTMRSLREFGRIFDRNPTHYRSVVLDVMRSQSGPSQGAKVPADELIDALAGHFRGEQQRREIDAGLDPRQLAEMLTGVYMYTIVSAIRRGYGGSVAERCERAADIFMRGCLAGRG
jgi:AcrR family transcriptional regulator